MSDCTIPLYLPSISRVVHCSYSRKSSDRPLVVSHALKPKSGESLSVALNNHVVSSRVRCADPLWSCSSVRSSCYPFHCSTTPKQCLLQIYLWYFTTSNMIASVVTFSFGNFSYHYSLHLCWGSSHLRAGGVDITQRRTTGTNYCRIPIRAAQSSFAKCYAPLFSQRTMPCCLVRTHFTPFWCLFLWSFRDSFDHAIPRTESNVLAGRRSVLGFLSRTTQSWNIVEYDCERTVHFSFVAILSPVSFCHAYASRAKRKSTPHDAAWAFHMKVQHSKGCVPNQQ